MPEAIREELPVMVDDLNRMLLQAEANALKRAAGLHFI